MLALYISKGRKFSGEETFFYKVDFFFGQIFNFFGKTKMRGFNLEILEKTTENLEKIPSLREL